MLSIVGIFITIHPALFCIALAFALLLSGLLFIIITRYRQIGHKNTGAWLLLLFIVIVFSVIQGALYLHYGTSIVKFETVQSLSH